MQWSLVDTRRLRSGRRGRRLPAEACAAMVEAERAVQAANALWARAEAEATALRRQAQEEGYAAGRAEALAHMATALADAQQGARAHLDASERRVVDLVLAVVERIAPRLASVELVPDLVAEALRSVRAERYLLIRVHPQAAAAVEERLAEWRQRPDTGEARVAGDDRLGVLDVCVETESGALQAGFNEQLRGVGDALRAASGP